MLQDVTENLGLSIYLSPPSPPPEVGNLLEPQHMPPLCQIDGIFSVNKLTVHKRHGDSHTWALGYKKHARDSEFQGSKIRAQKHCQDIQFVWDFYMATKPADFPCLLLVWKQLSIFYVKFPMIPFHLKNKVYCLPWLWGLNLCVLYGKPGGGQFLLPPGSYSTGSLTGTSEALSFVHTSNQARTRN